MSRWLVCIFRLRVDAHSIGKVWREGAKQSLVGSTEPRVAQKHDSHPLLAQCIHASRGIPWRHAAGSSRQACGPSPVLATSSTMSAKHFSPQLAGHEDTRMRGVATQQVRRGRLGEPGAWCRQPHARWRGCGDLRGRSTRTWKVEGWTAWSQKRRRHALCISRVEIHSRLSDRRPSRSTGLDECFQKNIGFTGQFWLRQKL